MHRCAPCTIKNEKDTQFFGEVSPWDAGKVPKDFSTCKHAKGP